MIRRLRRLGDGWVLPLSTEQMASLGISQADSAVLVRIDTGDPPRLIIRRMPTRDEAMEATLTTHAKALQALASLSHDQAGE